MHGVALEHVIRFVNILGVKVLFTVATKCNIECRSMNPPGVFYCGVDL